MTELPEGFSAVPKDQDLPTGYSSVPPTSDDFAIPADNKEGLYKMTGPQGPHDIRYSDVPAAHDKGFSFAGKDADRYAADRFEQTKKDAGNYVDSLFQPGQENGILSRAKEFVKGGVGNLEQAVQHPKNTLQAQGEQYLGAGINPETGAPLQFKSFDPQRDAEAIAQQKQLHEQLWENARAMQDHPAYMAGSIVLPPLITEGIGRVAPISRVARGAQRIIGGGAEAAEDLNVATLADNAKIRDANTAATEDFNKKTADAQHETAGKELTYKQAVNTKAEDIAAQDATDQSELAGGYQDQLDKTHTHNQQVIEKHKSIADRTAQENAATEQTLAMRQKQQADLGDLTQKYYAQEDAAKATAKGQENAAWQAWRDKMHGAMIDGSEITEPLQKLSTSSPEVSRTLSQLAPPPSEALPDSSYAQDRAAIMKSLGYGDTNYFDLPEAKRADIDHVAMSNGFEPDPIDFDPQAGRPIPVEQVHRANAILQQYLRNGRFEGPILGEMKQVAKVLRAAVSRASTEQGAFDELNAARDATTKYQGAFGRDRHQPITQDDIREKQANPEAYKERDDEERLSGAATIDPSLVDSFRQVKNARDRLKALPAEDKLRKSLKQVPAPPTVGDLRTGYSLLPEPQGPPATVTDSPVRRAAQQVPLPERVGLPTPPQLTPEKTVGPGEIQAAKTAVLEKRAQSIRSGHPKVANTLVILDMIRNGMHGNIAGMGYDLAARTVYSTGSQGYASLLETPTVKEWLTKPTAKDAAMIDPSIARDLAPLVEQAKQRGIKVSPAITAAISAHATKTNWYDHPSQ